MFRRIPYRGWLIGALIFWILTLAYYAVQNQKLQPEAMVATMEHDLAMREAALDKLLLDKNLLERTLRGSINQKELQQLSRLPFYLYAFDGENNLTFWNHNHIIAGCDPENIDLENGLLIQENGVYLKKCIQLPWMRNQQRLVALFPIHIAYPIRNPYLVSHFPASKNIPEKTVITDIKQEGSYAVKDISGVVQFYVTFPEGSQHIYAPNGWLIFLIIMSLSFSVAWINLTADFLCKKKKPIWGISLILSVSLFFLLCLYTQGLPFNLQSLPVFSSLLYASSHVFPSLGLLLVFLLLLLWNVLFTAYHLPLPVRDHSSKPNRLAQLGCSVLLVCSSLLAAQLIRSLVLDSKISFDVSNFNAVDPYTFAGFLAIALLLCIVVIAGYVLNKLLYILSGVYWKKYFQQILIALVIVLVNKGLHHWQYAAIAWIFVLQLLLDLQILRKPVSIPGISVIAWVIFFSCSSSAAIASFNAEKKAQQQKVFAETIARQKDIMLEYLFDDIGTEISQSRFLYNYLKSPNEERRVIVNERFNTRHLKGQIIKYQVDVYYYDSSEKPIYNKDTTSLRYFKEIIKSSQPTYNPYLFFRERTADGHYYIASVPVYGNDTIASGTIVLDLKLKTAVSESVYPELLFPGNIIEYWQQSKYSYAVYTQGKLVTQTDDYPFPMYLNVDTLGAGEVTVQYGGDYPIVHYKIDQQTVVSVLDESAYALEITSLFSYMLLTFIVFILIISGIQLLFRFLYKRRTLKDISGMSLRTQIMLAIPGIVLVSFIVISATTLWILIRRYEDDGKEKLRSKIQTAERAIQQYLREQNITHNAEGFYLESSSPRFRHFIVTLANTQRVDINVYDIYGTLMTSSQEDIYNKNILARIMMPQAYFHLMAQGDPMLSLKEQIGELTYVSAYVPLKNETGQVMGYINVPYFSSQQVLKSQISGVLVTLINLYAVIFFLSGLAAIWISNVLTRGLQLVTNRFRQFRLTGNEPVAWPYNDEVGLLVAEYNSMVKKVSDYATALAKTERETAWREMARQVAHEIKNPLTPMKLKVQYLLRAIQEGRADLPKLTADTSASLLEQIDNLAHIASAFSDFAKMPEARPEPIHLYELLEPLISLYKSQEQLEVRFIAHIPEALIYADKSQILRVFTNLLQNAAEAIPEKRKGKIEVLLYQEDKMACVQIRDNGSGIPEDTIPQIFSPYFTTKSSGTGLGLAMSKKIIEFWNGYIGFETKKDEGTIFTVKIPMMDT